MLKSILPIHKSEAEKALDLTFANRIDILNRSNLSTLPHNCSEEILPILEAIYNVSTKENSVAERRAILAKALELHQYKGTVYAVEVALSSVFESYNIREYKGYLFDVDVSYNDTNAIHLELWTKAKQLIKIAKNVRSHLRAITVLPTARQTEIHILSNVRITIKGEINNWNN